MSEYEYVKENYEKLIREIDEYGKLYGRSITVVAVTKSGTDEELLALAKAGAENIGENRPLELRRRGDLLYQNGFSPMLHEIGNLQRNKVKYIAKDVGLIHSLDNLPLAEEINKRAIEANRIIPALIEINSGKEENKGGVMPEDAEDFIKELKKYKNLEIKGLMTMGPVCECPEDARPYFRLTKELFDKLGGRYGFSDGILSMGMSDSYKVAIEEGSTLVRVGRKLFTNKN